MNLRFIVLGCLVLLLTVCLEDIVVTDKHHLLFPAVKKMFLKKLPIHFKYHIIKFL